MLEFLARKLLYCWIDVKYNWQRGFRGAEIQSTNFPKELKGKFKNQRTNGPVNAHLISWPSKAQNIQNLENIW